MNRREFLQVMAAAYIAGFTNKSFSKNITNYHHPFNADIRLLHITDTHAQLNPTFFREPNINLGTGGNKNIPPHIVGDNFLKYVNMEGRVVIDLMKEVQNCLLYTSPSPRDATLSRMPSSA